MLICISLSILTSVNDAQNNDLVYCCMRPIHAQIFVKIDSELIELRTYKQIMHKVYSALQVFIIESGMIQY